MAPSKLDPSSSRGTKRKLSHSLPSRRNVRAKATVPIHRPEEQDEEVGEEEWGGIGGSGGDEEEVEDNEEDKAEGENNEDRESLSGMDDLDGGLVLDGVDESVSEDEINPHSTEENGSDSDEDGEPSGPRGGESLKQQANGTGKKLTGKGRLDHELGASVEDIEAKARAEAQQSFQRKVSRLLSMHQIPSSDSSAPVKDSSFTSATSGLHQLLRNLASYLASLPSISPLSPTEAAERLSHGSGRGKQKKKKEKSSTSKSASNSSEAPGVQIPFPTSPCCISPVEDPSIRWKVAFEPPRDVKLMGSWVLGTELGQVDWHAKGESQGKDSKKGNEVKKEEKGKGKGKEKGQSWSVDVFLEMPSSIFQEKDYQSHRYFHKRAYYVAVLAQALLSFPRASDSSSKTTTTTKEGEKSDGGDWPPFEVRYEWLAGDERKPIVVLYPIQKGGSPYDISILNCRIRLIPAYQPNSLPTSRLHPSRHNIRLADSSEHQLIAKDDGPSTTPKPSLPSPTYNQAILADALDVQVSNFDHLRRVTRIAPSFTDACRLVKLWGRRRGYGIPAGKPPAPGLETPLEARYEFGTEGWNDFIDYLVGYLIVGGESSTVEGGKTSSETTRPKLPTTLSAIAMFRGVISFLASDGWIESPLLTKLLPNTKPCPSEEFVAAFDGILVDVTGTLNWLARFPRTSLDMIRYDAKMTLAELVEPNVDPFKSVFSPHFDRPRLRFDTVANISLGFSYLTAFSDSAGDSIADASGTFDAFLRSCSAVLRRALGDRARTISLLATSAVSWRPSQSPSMRFNTRVPLGLILDSTNAGRVVDHGPSAEDQTIAQEFRAFWGNKSEVRRFRDGGIQESLVWEADSPQARSLIVPQLIKYILAARLGLDKVDFMTGKWDHVLRPAQTAVDSSFKEDPKFKGFSAVVAAYEELTSRLESLKSLPLTISGITSASEGLRYSDVFVPPSIDRRKVGGAPECLKFVPVHDVQVTFESSSRWPEDLEAMQKLKAAFLAKMGESLIQSWPGCQAVVAFDSSASYIESNNCLELLSPTGYAFRLMIRNDVERMLLEASLSDKRITSDKTNKALVQRALDRHVRTFSCLPPHHQALRRLQFQASSYSPAVRLAKRWFSSHMLLGTHVPVELVELITCSVFLNPGPRGPPASGEAGFARIVELLSTWNWRTEPLFVPLHSSSGMELAPTTRLRFPSSKKATILREFSEHRNRDPGISHGAMIVVTEQDTISKSWGWERPSKLVAGRIVHLARATSTGLDQILDGLDPNTLFTPPISDFDFCIHLKRSAIPNYYHYINADPAVLAKAHKTKDEEHAVRIGFDPVAEFMNGIQKMFSDSVILFRDPFGSPLICGIFNPVFTTNAREFRVNLGFNCSPADVDEMVEDDDEESQGKPVKRKVYCNRLGIVAQIERLGQGIIDRVSLNSCL